MGLSYALLDAVLAAIEAGNTEAIEPTLLKKVQAMMARSAHKRAMPPVCLVSDMGRS
jgi:NH3-dependent NAD+ synthetase